jgi:hypothetical protein
MTAEEFADRFDISVRAAKIRLEEIQRMQRRRSGEKRPLPSGVLEFLQNARKKGFKVTSID